MYEEFYGFKEKPFSMLPDPGFLYLSKKHQTALTLLEYGLLNHVGFCVISGEPGAGKTTILRALLERVGDDITIGLITNTHQSFGGLLDWVLSAFDLHRPNLTHVEMHQIFMEYLIAEYARGHTVLLIIDEAQNMKPDVLEELRMLSNVNSEKDQLMQVVLAGQPALKDTLRLPDLMQFAQRIAVDYHLESLNLKETCGYIQHRLVKAGSQRDVFTPAACERIHNYSGGTPRLINLLCETVLVYGFADQQEMIGVELVDEMVLERMKDSVVPIVNRDIAWQDNSEASKALENDFPWIRPAGGIAEPQPVEEIMPAAVPDQEKTNTGEDTAQKTEQAEEKKTIAEKPLAEKPVASELNRVVPSRRNTGEAESVENDKAHKSLMKYGLIFVAVVLVLIFFSLVLGDGDKHVASEAEKAESQSLQLQREQDMREQEEKKLRQLQIQAETLKKERDAAIAKAEEEMLAKTNAEKQAKAQAEAAAKVALESRRMEEKKQKKAAQQREAKAKLAAAKAREEADRVKREAARLAEEMREMQARLEEERRLNQIEAARRLEQQKQEEQRQQIQASEAAAAVATAAAKAEEEAAASAVTERKKPVECSGPAARFKSACR
jgi:type II secretory pathway predicted ATPase ExeA